MTYPPFPKWGWHHYSTSPPPPSSSLNVSIHRQMPMSDAITLNGGKCRVCSRISASRVCEIFFSFIYQQRRVGNKYLVSVNGQWHSWSSCEIGGQCTLLSYFPKPTYLHHFTLVNQLANTGLSKKFLHPQLNNHRA